MARDDIADVAVAVLLETGDGHEGRAYDLTGPEALTMAEIAAELSRARRPDDHLPRRDPGGGVRLAGAPGWMVAGWVTTYTAIANGELEAVSGDVAAVAGHPPMGLAEFLGRNPDSLQHLRS